MSMSNCVQFCQIFFVLMLPVIVPQTTVVQNNFRKLDSEQNITGTRGANLKSGSHQECSLGQVSTNTLDNSFIILRQLYAGVDPDCCRLLILIISVTFIERFVHFVHCLKSHEPMSLFLTVGRHD